MPPASLPYHFALLHPLHHPRAGENAAVLGGGTLGVEVTEAVLAAQCGLGRLDPQHGAHPVEGRAAIDLALDWPVPPPGSLLVTQKADADALGAMAVLALRQAGTGLDEAARARVALVSRWDRFDQGDWPAWQPHHPPLPRPATPADLGGPPQELKAMRACAADRDAALADRVAGMARWIETGTVPEPARAAAQAFEAALLADWNAGHITITPTADRRLVWLDAPGRTGLSLGYRLAPVVLASGWAEGQPTRSIAQFQPGWIDLPRLAAALADEEPGWGGSPTILSAPQSGLSPLPDARLLALTQSCLGPRTLD